MAVAKAIKERLESLAWPHVAAWAAALTVAIELLTVLLRFGAGLEAHADTAFMASVMFGLRGHHGFWGIGLLVAAALAWRKTATRNGLLVLGSALLASDAIHHFLVLWPLTGSPEFHLRYGA